MVIREIEKISKEECITEEAEIFHGFPFGCDMVLLMRDDNGKFYLSDQGGRILTRDRIKQLIRYCRNQLTGPDFDVASVDAFNRETNAMIKARDDKMWAEMNAIDNRKRPKRTGFVYLMKDEINGLFKIGFSKNPEYRESTLQGEKPSIVLVSKIEGTMEDEAHLHDIFSKKRVRGEWFSLSQYEAENIFKELDNER